MRDYSKMLRGPLVAGAVAVVIGMAIDANAQTVTTEDALGYKGVGTVHTETLFDDVYPHSVIGYSDLNKSDPNYAGYVYTRLEMNDNGEYIYRQDYEVSLEFAIITDEHLNTSTGMTSYKLQYLTSPDGTDPDEWFYGDGFNVGDMVACAYDPSCGWSHCVWEVQ